MADSNNLEGEQFRRHAELSDVHDASELFKDYDSQAVRAAIEAAAGSWSDVDAEKLIADLYVARAQGSRPANRPKFTPG